MVATVILYYAIFKKKNTDVLKVSPMKHLPITDDETLYRLEQKLKDEGTYEPPSEITYYTPSDKKMAVEETYE
jgi:hypothetical protein